LSSEELSLLGIHQALQRPASAEKIHEAAARETVLVQSAPGGTSEIDDSLETVEEEQDYFGVPAAEALGARRAHFELFLRLPSGKYSRVVKAGEEVPRERVENYLKKGLHTVFLKVSEQENYLSHCDRMARDMLKNPSVSIDMKVHQMVQHGEHTLRFLKRHGLRESQLLHASAFVAQIHELVAQADLRKHSVFKAFMTNLAALEHGTATSIVAALAATHLKVQPSVQSLGIASLFHDIGLLHLPPELQDEDESKMSPQQLETFRAHPVLGAQILRSVPQFDAMAALAVEHHHVRLNGKGFPTLPGGAKASPLAEMVGISEEFARLISRAKDQPRLEPLKVMEAEVFSGFSRPVVEAFRSFFFLTLL
jgi:HD-GYP domain-containing protein (c-di-GMP phosphodiesterase class II)